MMTNTIYLSDNVIRTINYIFHCNYNSKYKNSYLEVHHKNRTISTIMIASKDKKTQKRNDPAKYIT